MTFVHERFLSCVQQCPTAVAMLLGCVLSIGCDHEPDNQKPGDPVSITILSGGQPVAEGQVDLSGQGGGSTLNDQGVAEFKHVPYGQYQVIVLPPEPSPVPPEPGSAAVPVAPAADFPAKFRSEKTTPLSIEVKADGENSFSFDLQG